MRISEDEARRWYVLKPDDKDGQPLLQIIQEWEQAEIDQIPDEGFNLNPSVEDLLEALKLWQWREQQGETRKKELARRLMEYRFVSITQLADAIGVSRPTLYAWAREFDEQQARNTPRTDGD